MKRQVRILLAWFDGGDAVAAQLGFRLPEPNEDVSAQKALYETQVAARLARVPFTAQTSDAKPLPDPISERGNACLASIAKTVAKSDLRRLRAGMIDLRQVLSLQKAVSLDQIEQRLSEVTSGDWPSLADICLPEAGEEPTLQGTYDRDSKGLTITSPNPNLRVSQIQNFVLPGSGQRMIGFQILFGSSHVHVVNYNGRTILKDGYHRCYGLLARGIHWIPCIIEEALSFSDVHSRSATLIAPEDLLGPHPPLLTDFHDPNVSITVEQQAFRKAVRIRADDFAVNI